MLNPEWVRDTRLGSEKKQDYVWVLCLACRCLSYEVSEELKGKAAAMTPFFGNTDLPAKDDSNKITGTDKQDSLQSPCVIDLNAQLISKSCERLPHDWMACY